jgi:hypothetical protein
MKESKKVKIEANLIIKSNEGAEVIINNTDEKVIINYNYQSLPVIPLSTFKKSWSFRKKSKYLAQDIYFFANHRLVLRTKKGRIIYKKPFFFISLLIKSLFVR